MKGREVGVVRNGREERQARRAEDGAVRRVADVLRERARLGGLTREVDREIERLGELLGDGGQPLPRLHVKPPEAGLLFEIDEHTCTRAGLL